jgi:hypothetical protein
MWWTLVFSAATTTGLVLLVFFLVAMYTVASVIMDATGHRDSLRADGNGFGAAFALAVVVNLGSALMFGWLAGQSPLRTWPPVLQGLAASLLALALALCAISVPLGVSPVDLLRLVLDV